MTTLPALMATLTRLLRRLLLAATLLLTRTRVALLRLARLRLVRVAHALSPQGLTGPTPLASTHGTAESCGAKRAMRVRNSRDIDANFRQNFAANPKRVTLACKRDRGRRARDRWARGAPFRPRRRIRCGCPPI